MSKIETTVAAKFQQLQDLFPDANVVSMVESDATVLLYDYTSVSVKVSLVAERSLFHTTMHESCGPRHAQPKATGGCSLMQ